VKIELVNLDAVRASHKNEAVPYANAAKRVVDWRREHGKMSQEDFAALAQVSVGCLQALEKQIRNTRRPNLEKIAKAMALSYEQLIAGDTEPIRTDDPRVQGFYPDDFEVLGWYHHADGDTKQTVRRTLLAYYRHAAERERSQTKEALRPPSEATFRERRAGERRSGIDRRHDQPRDDRAADRRRAEGE
jgi:Helix-turn-helix